MATRFGSRHLLRGLVAIGATVLAAATARAAVIIVPDDNPSLVDAVRGAAAGDTIQVRPGDYLETVRVVTGQDGLTIEGLGGRPHFIGANRKDGVVARLVSNVTIRGIDFERRKVAVNVSGCNGCVVQDVHVDHGRNGIRVRASIGAIVVDNVLTDVSDGVGMSIDKSPGALVGGNVITGTTDGFGLSVRGCDGGIVATNTVNGGRRGIRVQNGASVTVDGNTGDDNLSEGIFVRDIDGLTITGNTANGNGKIGIQVRDSPPIATVADLTSAGNTASGNPIDFDVQP